MMQLFGPRVPSWTEVFGGSCAVGFALAGIPCPPFVYQGGKKALAIPTLHKLRLGCKARASRYVFNDIGLSTTFYRYLQAAPAEVAAAAALHARGREGFDRIVGSPVREAPHLWAADYAAIQASVVMGKPPTIVDGYWKTAGYAEVSPAGRERGFTDRLNPPALARRLSYSGQALQSMDVEWVKGCASELDLTHTTGGVLYIDGPYVRTTGYSTGGADRLMVMQIANKGIAAGALVVVAESEPIDLDGAVVIELHRSDGRPLTKERREYLTVVDARADQQRGAA